MCGIYGFISKNEYLKHEQILKEGIYTLIKRGPDSNGIWFNKNDGIGLSHARLSILDLSINGHQPMTSHSGRYVLSFNGEIYNHQEIREKFKGLNFNIEFKSSSDTETLLESIEIFGLKKTLANIQGMFAFSLWDKKKKKLIIARDGFGEKPLYYGWINNSFVFASEIKALKTFPNFKKDLNLEALDNYLKYGYIPIGSCIFSDIKKLEPGCFLSISIDKFKEKIETFWSISEVFSKSKMDPFTGNLDDAIEEFECLFDKTIKNQLISDAPIGAFLSGGIDSAYVVSSMAKQSKNKIRTFSIGFEDQKYDEAKYARKISNFIGTDHSEIYLKNNDLIEKLLLSPNIYDEPFADSSQIPTLCLSQFASEKVKVVLTGDGADELFGGYNRYKYHNLFHLFNQFKPSFLNSYLSNLDAELLYKIYLKIPRIFRNQFLKSIESQNSFNKIKKISALIRASSSKEYYNNILTFDYQNNILKNKAGLIYNSVINEAWENINSKNDLEKMMLIDQKFYLSDNILFKVDRACMSNSLENRTPFIDQKILDFIWSLPLEFKIKGQDTKHLLKKCIHKNIPKNIFNNTKMGFTFPINDFLDGPLYEMTNDLLSFSNIKEKGIFDPKEIEKIKLDHKTKRKDNSELIWKLINFQNWANTNIF